MTRSKTVKVDSEIVKARNRARSYYRREAQRFEQQSLDEAREALRRAMYQSDDSDRRVRSRSASVIQYVTAMSQPVLASLDIRPRVRVDVDAFPTSSAPVAQAWTDFRDIHINIRGDAYSDTDPSQVARLIALTKGLIYHEAGHILYTVPVPQLHEQAVKDEGALSLPDLNVLWGQNRYAWNLAEDQRMECAVVRTSPIIERYFQVIVVDLVTAQTNESGLYHLAWPFVSGRTYLPKGILQRFREHAVEHARLTGKGDVLKTIDDCIREYKRAKTATEMLEIVLRLTPALEEWNGRPNPSNGGGIDRHDYHPANNREGLTLDKSATNHEPWNQPKFKPQPQPQSDKTSNPEGRVSPAAEPSSDSSDQAGDRSDTGSNGVTDDQRDNEPDAPEADDGSESGADDDSSNTEVSDNYQPGDGIGSQEGDGTEQKPEQDGLDDLQDLVNDLINDLVSPDAINDFLSSVNDAINRGLPPDPSIQDMPPHLSELAHKVRDGMLDTLEPLAVQADPAWRFRQETGVLDPTAFLTAQPGETDYWTDLDGEGGRGHDLALSVVLDLSFSMGEHTDALSVGAIGIRLACDALGIPCTITTFSSNGYLLMDADDETREVLVSAHGGTQPMDCLTDLPGQSLGKTRHLVIVFTDGEWSGVPSFAQFRTNSMYIIGVAFGYGVAETMENRRPDAVVALDSVTQLPAEVTKALAGYLA